MSISYAVFCLKKKQSDQVDPRQSVRKHIERTLRHSSVASNQKHHIRSIASIEDLFFFTDTATTEIYTLSLHDALPVSVSPRTCTIIVAFVAPAGRNSVPFVGK